MVLKENGWLHRTVFWCESREKRPLTTNVCKLFWFSLFQLLIVHPLGVIWTITIWLSAPIQILFGYRPLTFWEVCRDSPCLQDLPPFAKHIKRWPTIRGWRLSIMPLIIIGSFCLGGGYILWLLLWKGIWQSFILGTCFGNSLRTQISLAITCLVAVVTTIIVCELRGSEWWLLAKSYLKALKDKVCPLVRFQ